MLIDSQDWTRESHHCTHNEEAESDHHRFHSDIEVHGELDPKVITVCKDLSEKP